MAGDYAEVVTVLPIEQAATIFQDSMKRGLFTNFRGKGTRFAEPPRDDAFDDVEGDPPTFELMAEFYSSSGSTSSGVLFYAWDRGTHRELRIDSATLQATRMTVWSKVKKAIASMQQADPTLSYKSNF